MQTSKACPVFSVIYTLESVVRRENVLYFSDRHPGIRQKHHG